MERKRLNGRFIKSGKYKSCDWCKKIFYVVASRLQTKRFCSASCQYKFGRNNPRGNKAYNWRGGKRIFKDGYVRIYMPEHPFAVKGVYVLEHRLVMEKHLRRYLKSDEIIHHKGIKYPVGSIKNKQDNRLKNLKLTTRSKHINYHRPLNSDNDVSKVANPKHEQPSTLCTF